MKWMDKKEVYTITTVHEVGFCPTGKKHWRTREDIMKPVVSMSIKKVWEKSII